MSTPPVPRPGDPTFVGPVVGPRTHESYLRAVESQVRSEYGGSIPNIKFDREGIDKVIERLNIVLEDHLLPAVDKVDRLYSVTPPGGEYASAGFANRANDAGMSYKTYLEGKIQGINDYKELLVKIRDKYLQDEEGQAGSFNRTET